MKKKLVFLDLDGTLWTLDGIPESAKKAISRARNNGHKVFANTGRTQSEAAKELYSIPLDGYVFSAGSHIIADQKECLCKPLSMEQIQAIQDFLDPLDVGYSLEGKERTFMNKANQKFFAKAQEANRVGVGVFPDFSKMKKEDFGQIMKVSVLSKDPIDFSNLSSLGLVFTPFTIEAVKDYFIGEITMKEYTKGTAIDFLKSHYKDYETMAFGDSENDVSMLLEADISVAMGNGNENVKKIADHITDDINQDGLYKAFEYYGLLIR